MKTVHFLICALAIFVVVSCKPGDAGQGANRSTQQNTIPIPANVVEKGQGLSSKEMNTIYSYALDMSYFQCERLGAEVTLKNATTTGKEKIAELDPQIEALQLEIDQYLGHDETRLAVYFQAMQNEMAKCKWLQNQPQQR